MKITEADVKTFRRPDWRGVLGYPRGGAADDPYQLPSHYFTDSDELFPGELTDGEGRVMAFLAFRFGLPTLSDDYDWYAVSHQSGGYACDHPAFVGTPLRLRPDMAEGLQRLALRFDQHSAGHFYRGNVTFSDLTEYAGCLAEMGLHCEHSYEELEEAFYPIDATQAHLDLLCENPPRLDVVKPPTEAGLLMIVVLTENSD